MRQIMVSTSATLDSSALTRGVTLRQVAASTGAAVGNAQRPPLWTAMCVLHPQHCVATECGVQNSGESAADDGVDVLHL
jgi:hypothetical protein